MHAWDPAHKGQWWLDGHPPQRLGVASGAQLQGETLAATAGLHAQFDGWRHKGGGEVASSGFSPRWGCGRVLCSRPGEEEAERVLASWFGSGSWTSFRARTSSHDLSGSASGPVWHPLGSTLAPPWWRSQCRGRRGTVDAASGGDGDGAPDFAARRRRASGSRSPPPTALAPCFFHPSRPSKKVAAVWAAPKGEWLGFACGRCGLFVVWRQEEWLGDGGDYRGARRGYMDGSRLLDARDRVGAARARARRETGEGAAAAVAGVSGVFPFSAFALVTRLA